MWMTVSTHPPTFVTWYGGIFMSNWEILMTTATPHSGIRYGMLPPSEDLKVKPISIDLLQSLEQEEPAQFDLGVFYYKNHRPEEVNWDALNDPRVSKLQIQKQSISRILEAAENIPAITVRSDAIQTGRSIYKSDTREILASYCIDHRNPVNLLNAVTNRVLARPAVPNTAELRDMTRFMELEAKHYKYIHYGEINMENYLARHKRHPLSKQNMYREAWSHFMNFSYRETQSIDYDAFLSKVKRYILSAKADEENRAWVPYGARPTAELYKRFEARARAIGCVSREYNFAAPYNEALLKCCKDQDIGFIYGAHGDDYAQFVKFANDNDLAVVTEDFSQFDGSVDGRLMEARSSCFEHILREYAKTTEGLTDRSIEVLIRSFKSVTHNYTVSYKTIPIMRFKLYGTTGSGDFFETTWGNTMINLMLHRYILRRIGLDLWADASYKFPILACAGDDSWIAIPKSHLHAYLLESRRVVTQLGMKLKEQTIQTENIVLDFCSKTSVKSGDEYLITRDFVKMMTNSRFYLGSNFHLRQDPRRHTQAVYLSDLPHLQLYGICNSKISYPGIRHCSVITEAERRNMFFRPEENLAFSEESANALALFFKHKYNVIVKPNEVIDFLDYLDSMTGTDAIDMAYLPKYFGALPDRVRQTTNNAVSTMPKKNQNSTRPAPRKRKPRAIARTNRPNKAPISNVRPIRIDREPIYLANTQLPARANKNKSQMQRMRSKYSKLDYGERLNSDELKYAESLLDPFANVRIKIPNIYPIPTSTYTVSTETATMTNTNGNSIIRFCPWRFAQTVECNANAISPDTRFDDGVIYERLGSSLALSVGLPQTQPANYSGFAWTSADNLNAIYMVNSEMPQRSQIARFRVVSAGIVVTNVSPATTRSGAITSGHALVDPDRTSIKSLRQLATSYTSNADEAHTCVYVPHDPNCYNFYEYTCYVTYTRTSITADWTVLQSYDYPFWQPPINAVIPMLNTWTTDLPPEEVADNWCYFAITGSPGQNYEVKFSINYEIIPTQPNYAILQPMADSKGVPGKTMEALSCATGGDSLWQETKAWVADSGKSLLRTVGTKFRDYMSETMNPENLVNAAKLAFGA